MEDVYDVLTVALGAYGIAPVPTTSLAAWLIHRRSRISLTSRPH